MTLNTPPQTKQTKQTNNLKALPQKVSTSFVLEQYETNTVTINTKTPLLSDKQLVTHGFTPSHREAPGIDGLQRECHRRNDTLGTLYLKPAAEQRCVTTAPSGPDSLHIPAADSRVMVINKPL